jgi:hypothetical protein
LKLVAGLGNPGAKYAGTRHNIGFMVAEELAGRSGISLKKNGYQGIYGVGRVAGEEVTILLPQTFMNLSGVSVAGACKSLGVNRGFDCSPRQSASPTDGCASRRRRRGQRSAASPLPWQRRVLPAR